VEVMANFGEGNFLGNDL